LEFNLNSISNKEMERDIISWLSQLPDDEVWRDYFNGSFGKILVKFIAGLASFVKKEALINRREAFSHYAKNRSSRIASAQDRGYSVYRGDLPQFNLVVYPTQTIYYPKYSVIGSHGENSIIVLNDITFFQNEPIEVKVKVGKFRQENTYIPTSDFSFKRLYVPEISEEYRFLYIEDALSLSKYENKIDLLDLVNTGKVKEVSVSEDFSDLSYGDLAVITNSFNSVDIYLLNDSKISLASGNFLRVEYLEYSFVEIDSLKTSFKLNVGNVEDVELEIESKPRETRDSISLNAQIRNETGNVIKARADSHKLFRNLLPNLADVNSEDISPAEVDICYVKEDETVILATEQDYLLSAFRRPMGVKPPRRLVKGRAIEVSLKINVLFDTTNTIQSSIQNDVTDILIKYEKKLGASLDLYGIEGEVKSLGYIKAVRVELLNNAKLKLLWDEYYKFVFVVGSLN